MFPALNIDQTVAQQGLEEYFAERNDPLAP